MSKSTPASASLSGAKLELFALLLKKRGIKTGTPQTIQPRKNSEPCPLSFAQERIWQMAQLEGRPSIYNFEVKLDGTLDAAVLESSLGEVIRRNEVLRTTFSSIDGHVVQIINPEQCFSLPVVDLTGQPEIKRAAQARQLSIAQGVKPFDLRAGPLFRFALLRLNAESHRLLLTIPHITCDHSSIQMLAGEVASVYNAYIQGQPSPLAELTIQYADYTSWERERLQGEVYETELAYWRKQLDGCRPALQLPTDRLRPPVKTYRGAQLLISLSRDLSKAVQLLAQREKCTVFMTLLAAFKALLYRYTGQQDMIVGTAVAGRTHRGIEELIGNFGTALALRTHPTGATTFKELLREVRDVSLAAYKHQDIPFDRLVEELQLERDPSYYPLIQVGFVVHTTPAQDSVAFGNLNMEIANSHSGRAIFDLNLRMHHTPDGLTGAFEYNTDLFDSATISRMLEQFKILLAGIVGNSEQTLADLPLLAESERQQLLTQGNANAASLPEETFLRQLLEGESEHFVYLLDDDMNLAPLGVPGELYAGGRQLASDRRSRTEAELVTNPSDITGPQLYKTGLRARFHADSSIEFLGSLDQRVEVRGFMVELTKIEAALNQHPSVLRGIVCAEETTDGALRLAVSVVPAPNSHELVADDLNNFLKARLPAYMLPASIVLLDGAQSTSDATTDYALAG